MVRSKKQPTGNDDIVRELRVAYGMEIETIPLAADVPTELLHAQQLAQRINTIGGGVPGSLDNKPSQKYLQPLKDTTDVVAVIRGVIAAEEAPGSAFEVVVNTACAGLPIDAASRQRLLTEDSLTDRQRLGLEYLSTAIEILTSLHAEQGGDRAMMN